MNLFTRVGIGVVLCLVFASFVLLSNEHSGRRAERRGDRSPNDTLVVVIVAPPQLAGSNPPIPTFAEPIAAVNASSSGLGVVGSPTPEPPSRPSSTSVPRMAAPLPVASPADFVDCDAEAAAFVRNSRWLLPTAPAFKQTCKSIGRCDKPGSNATADLFRYRTASMTVGRNFRYDLAAKVRFANVIATPIEINVKHNYEVENVCIDSRGGLSGYDGTTRATTRRIDVADESFISWPLIIRRLESAPTCFYNQTVVVVPYSIQFSILSSNPSHVLYKALGSFLLRRRHERQYRRRQATDGGPSREWLPPLYVFQQIPDKISPEFAETSSFLRFLMPVLAPAWASVLGFAADATTLPDVRQTSVCFRRGVIGFEPLIQGGLRKERRLVALAQEFRRAVAATRNISLREVPGTVISPPHANATSFRVTILQRSKDTTTKNARAITGLPYLIEAARQAFGWRLNITFTPMGALSMLEQATIAANTDILVGAHGAGLVWSFMMPPGGVVVELSNYFRFGFISGVQQNCAGIYGSTSALMKQQHVLRYSPSPTPQHGKDKSFKHQAGGNRGSNVLVDANSFVAILNLSLCLITHGANGRATACSELAERVPCPRCVPGTRNNTVTSDDCLTDEHFVHVIPTSVDGSFQPPRAAAERLPPLNGTRTAPSGSKSEESATLTRA